MNSKKTFTLFVYIFLFYTKTYSQCTIEGKVFNNFTKSPIPYASISLKNEKVGISANQNGEFILKYKCINGDTLVISALNFITKKIATSKLLNNNTIELLPKNEALNPVIVNSEIKKEIAILNEIDNCSINWYLGTESVHQVAQIYYSPFLVSKIRGIQLCKMRGKASFRIRIYNVDTVTMKPSNEISDSAIIVNSKKRKCYIDFEQYDIEISKNVFFVSIEWLLSEENAYYEKIEINGKKTRQKYFEPSICIGKNRKDKLTGNEMNPMFKTNGTWHTMSKNIESFLISVLVQKVQ